MGLPARAADAYRQTEVQSRTPLELVVMLYDGALVQLGLAHDAMVRHDVAVRGAALSRTIAIVGELQATLDMTRGGEVAASLDRLYDYANLRLLDAAMRADPEPIAEVRKLFEILREGWNTAAHQ